MSTCMKLRCPTPTPEQLWPDSADTALSPASNLLAMSADGVPLAPAAAAARDATVARLLEIAAALDEALATLDPKSVAGPAQVQALERLRGEVEFAEQALPRIERARRGEETPLPV